MQNQETTRCADQDTAGTIGKYRPMYIKTPLVESRHLTTLAGGTPVYLKLENTQPCGAFKLRGISHIIQKVKKVTLPVYVRTAGIIAHVTFLMSSLVNDIEVMSMKYEY